jgi:adenylate cyclase
MMQSETTAFLAWLVEQGLAGANAPVLLEGFVRRCADAGLHLSRAVVFIDTLHPIFEGGGARWSDGGGTVEAFTYGSSSEGSSAAMWQRSPLYALVLSGRRELRLNFARDGTGGFPVLDEMQAEGHTDYCAFLDRFGAVDIIGETDCVYSHWYSRAPEGFAETDLAALRQLVPALALAVKAAALAHNALTLADVYLGRDAARRVLSGRISRGVPDRITAVLWFSDLRGYTRISDTADPGEIIPLLNDYAEAAIAAIHGDGGDVLKLIGDGVLAIFTDPDPARAGRAALRAEHAMRARVAALNARRLAAGQPVTTIYAGLHVGEVLYGNIGSQDRLDFTVVGPAVNEVSRIASMCRSAERNLLVSAELRAALRQPESDALVAVGRFALRGVNRADFLYTLDPAITVDGEAAGAYARILSRDSDGTI